MKFEQALEIFKRSLEAEYGVSDGLIKIAIHPELFRAVMLDLSKTGLYSHRFEIGSLGECIINGVQILQRQKDNF